MLAGVFFANAVITLRCTESVAGSHCGPSGGQPWLHKLNRLGYTTGYTNDPQKGCIRLNSVEHACLNATQNETAIIQWIKVKVKKVMVGMARFELATS